MDRVFEALNFFKSSNLMLGNPIGNFLDSTRLFIGNLLFHHNAIKRIQNEDFLECRNYKTGNFDFLVITDTMLVEEFQNPIKLKFANLMDE